jgi:hypothetical protein
MIEKESLIIRMLFEIPLTLIFPIFPITLLAMRHLNKVDFKQNLVFLCNKFFIHFLSDLHHLIYLKYLEK